MKLLVLISLLLAGCGKYETKANQAEALSIVWAEAYGMFIEAPRVEWVDPPKLNCSNAMGFETAYGVDGSSRYGCVGGVSYNDTWMIKVAWPVGSVFSNTAFSHELCHMRMFTTTGDADGDHTGPCFVPGGYVDEANALLETNGL